MLELSQAVETTSVLGRYEPEKNQAVEILDGDGITVSKRKPIQTFSNSHPD